MLVLNVKAHDTLTIGEGDDMIVVQVKRVAEGAPGTENHHIRLCVIAPPHIDVNHASRGRLATTK